MRPPRAPWDAAWKALVQQVFHPWLAYFFPAVAALVDPSQPPEFLDTELRKIAPQAARGRSHVDRLVRVRLRDGSPGLLLIHIEIQSQGDAAFPLRLLLYNVTLLLHSGVPVCSLALLADPSRTWKPDRAVVQAPATRLTLEYSICKLADLDPGPPRDGEPMLNHVVRAWRMTRDTTGDAMARRNGKIQLARTVVRAAQTEGCCREEAAAALRFLETVASLPPRLEEEYCKERNLMAMKTENLNILTYGEKKAYREGREDYQRETAWRMREMGLDLKTIAKALRLTRKAATALLETPPQPRESDEA